MFSGSDRVKFAGRGGGAVYMKKAGLAKRAGPHNPADFHLALIWQTGWFSAWLLIPLC